ncbi:hypothetical protein WP12_07605 [Sphingomonas sp. SRS2]|nr:hypothetical protein WP12_07605 [Sphingomonas sp. SRS2]
MLGKISGRLSAEGRVGRSHAFAMISVTAGAAGNAARRVTALVQYWRGAGYRRGDVGLKPERCEVVGYRIVLRQRQLACDCLHFGMPAPAAGVSFELRGHVAPVQPGKARCARTVAPPVQAMTCHAGIGRASIATAQRDQLAGACELVGRPPFDRAARGKR